MVNIGILNLQGDVEEHEIMTKKALEELNIDGQTILVNVLEDIKKCDALIISGGESSTIGMHLEKTKIDEYLIESKIPIFGTCAGMILLSNKVEQNQPLLGLIDIKAKRNGFGRQKMSFETNINFNNQDYLGVFIRAPYIEEVGENVEVLSTYNDKIIAVKQNQYLALAFHPELTDDTSIHQLFLKEVLNYI